MYSRIIIMGRLGHDPKLSTSKSGKEFAKFNVAVDTGYGEQRKTTWYQCVAFGRTAQNCAQYLRKGSVALVDGALSVDEYKGRDGSDKYALVVTADTVTFVTKSEQPEGRPAERGQYSAPSLDAEYFGGDAVENQDLPF